MEEVKEYLYVLPSRMLEEISSSESEPVDAVIFVGISLVLGIASRHLLRGTKVPYTVALLIIGLGLGSLEHGLLPFLLVVPGSYLLNVNVVDPCFAEYGTSHKLGRIGDGIRLWNNIDPDLLLAVFLPALLFESAFSMEVHQIKRCMAQMVLLAGPGVIISTFCLGFALKITFPYEWNWKTSLLLGGLLSATDPVAVVALLKELGASKKLSTIIEGESLMNDGTAIVVYQLFFKMVNGESFSWDAIIGFLAKVALGAVGLGIAFGIASVLWLGFIFNDTVIEITLTVAVSYVVYFTGQEGIEVSGVLAVMTLGMFYAAVAKTAFKGDGQQSLHHFWEMVAYIANTLIFILSNMNKADWFLDCNALNMWQSGVVIAEGILGNDKIFQNNGNSWGYLILLYIFVQLSRCIVVGVLYPFLRYFGYGLDLKEAAILIWSGLRGAVALSLSLSVKAIHFFTGGIVFLTLIVNGSTTQFILHFLGLDKLSAAKKRILDYTKYEMLNKAFEAFEDLVDDEELGPADWPTVKRYITSLNDLEGDRVHPHTESEADNDLDPSNLKDIRIRLLNGVQAAYWGMLDEGRIAQSTANLLMQSVDEAVDAASHEPLCDWKGLKSNVQFPNYYKFLQRSMFPQKLITFFTVERLENGCCICAAFLRAHRIARRQLHEFIGDSVVASTVIAESEAEGEEARKFLEDVRITFPQVAFCDLWQLHVKTDLKRLLRNPPLVKIPKINDIISAHPFLGALPSSVRESLECSTKEKMKTRGMTLYKRALDQMLNIVIWQWKSKSIRNKHSMHPTFTHGSTLGLYEVLVGKPYICDMVSDSVVLCFFIESNRILSILRSDPALEDFLWQESAIVLAKLLFPQIFEKIALHDLRALVAERSSMKTYITGETIEVSHQSVGFMLEGFIKPSHAEGELIKSPAVLLPSQGNQSFLHADKQVLQTASFSHQRSGYLLETRGSIIYQVETRARVIIFDIGTLEGNRVLRNNSSSFNLSHRSLTREHGGLMSWPEHFFRGRQHTQNHDATDQEVNRLSARAMQLSIFGSKVNLPQRSWSLSRMNQSQPINNPSYNRFLSFPGHLLVSAGSEGASTMRKNNKEAGKIKGEYPQHKRRRLMIQVMNLAVRMRSW
ncbi:hypothetical protein CXB51_005099 [Gossypium anomalum]|uniref:Cation/H+ exchanger transmembrane domain-containing protein n=1 Tax=Gossypium anomalum TaxID=47600 RepID=A0A8J5ZW35_9ROSI|nr:hypothetical protein CXB51_005099 [Gossypium anomalum]